MKMTKVDARVSVETREKLDEIAKVLGVKRADLIRAAFKRYIAAFNAGLLTQEIPQDGSEKKK